MNVISINHEVTLFQVIGKLEGNFLLDTQYGYRCTPHHPKDKSYLSCISKSVWNFLNNTTINFNIEVHIQFDNGGKKPKVSDLLDIVIQANLRMNQILILNLLKRPDLGPLEISPIHQEETISALEECLLIAYPEN
jgi:hypothetical protein